MAGVGVNDGKAGNAQDFGVAVADGPLFARAGQIRRLKVMGVVIDAYLLAIHKVSKLDFGVISLVGTIDDGDSRGFARNFCREFRGDLVGKGRDVDAIFAEAGWLVRCAGDENYQCAKDSQDDENWVVAGDFV